MCLIQTIFSFHVKNYSKENLLVFPLSQCVLQGLLHFGVRSCFLHDGRHVDVARFFSPKLLFVKVKHL